MKNQRLKATLTATLLVLLVLCLPVTALAQSSVTFENGKLIVLAPGSIHSDSDLFGNLKGVMPGDELTEEIEVKNNSSDFDYIKVYLRAIPHDETDNPLSENVAASGETVASMQDFLAQLSMKVFKGTEVLFDASPDQLNGLAANVLLGTLRQGEAIKLDVVLAVPIELGNEYANRAGEVDWIFTVEGFDDPVPTTTSKPTEAPTTAEPETTKPLTVKPGTTKPDVPQTGESINPWTVVLGVALVIVALALIALLIRRVRNKSN